MANMYLAKYALSAGIKEVSGHFASGGEYLREQGGPGFYRIGRDVFADRSDAVAAAEAARVKKIASLHKQIAKLEKLNFS